MLPSSKSKQASVHTQLGTPIRCLHGEHQPYSFAAVKSHADTSSKLVVTNELFRLSAVRREKKGNAGAAIADVIRQQPKRGMSKSDHEGPPGSNNLMYGVGFHLHVGGDT